MNLGIGSLYLTMKRLVLTVYLSAVGVMMQLAAAEVTDWKSIHLIQGFNYFNFAELPFLTDQESEMIASLASVAHTSHHQVILKNQGEYFAFNTCELNHWKWEYGVWKKKTAHDISGYNCTPYFFIRDKQPFVLSGSGYWQNQTDLFKLNETTGEAEFIKNNDQPINFRGHLNFQVKEGIYTLFGYQYDARIDLYSFEPQGYFYDFSSNSWKKLKVTWNKNPERALEDFKLNQLLDWMAHVETDNYALIELHENEAIQSFWLIVDKRDLSIYIKEIPFLQFLDSKWTQTLEGDRVLLLDRNSSKSSEINLQEVVESSVHLGSISFDQESLWDQFMDTYYPVFVIFPLGLMILGGWWIGWKRKKTSSTSLAEEESDPLEVNPEIILWHNKLKPLSGKLIDQDQMDALFELSEIKNSDLRKVKRSRAIKAINDFLKAHNCPPAIHRVRDTQDKRVIRYKIQVVPFQKIKNQPVKIS